MSTEVLIEFDTNIVIFLGVAICMFLGEYIGTYNKKTRKDYEKVVMAGGCSFAISIIFFINGLRLLDYQIQDKRYIEGFVVFFVISIIIFCIPIVVESKIKKEKEIKNGK